LEPNIVYVYYTRFHEKTEVSAWEDLFKGVPGGFIEYSGRYKLWQDQHRFLFGRLLLKYALAEAGYPVSLLSEITYNPFGRPGINKPFDFNISHSGNYAGCAFSLESRIGLDIQELIDFSPADFHAVMSKKQEEKIALSQHKNLEFTRLWSLKESVIKAIGKGVSTQLDLLEMDGDTVRVENRDWYIRGFSPDAAHVGYIASSHPVSALKLIEVQFTTGTQ
jgi:4'-phosphopantetheinyl transferase